MIVASTRSRDASSHRWARFRMFARPPIPSASHAGWASRARSTRLSISGGVTAGSSATRVPVAGLRTSSVDISGLLRLIVITARANHGERLFLVKLHVAGIPVGQIRGWLVLPRKAAERVTDRVVQLAVPLLVMPH